MYSPARKIRASVRRTIWLILIGFVCGLLLLETVVQLSENSVENQYAPTRSAGLMLNRSQMLLSKEILFEPKIFNCKTKLNKKSSKIYPLFIIVKTRAVSSGDYLQRRMFTRTSWGQEAQSLGIPVIYAIGRAQDENVQKMLEIEHENYGDLLQFNYIDAYYNVSIKTTGILNWFVNRNCQSLTEYLFIVDDDVLINIKLLLKMISTNSFNSQTLYGLYLTDIEPHPSGKWAVSLIDYPNQTYPNFVTGASTLYPTLIVSKIVRRIFDLIEQNRSIFFLDDVLINGIIPQELNISRSSLFGIEDCSFTDLFSRIVISECNNARRVYVWLKYLLSNIGQTTYEIDRLIQTTNFEKWRGDFKHMRNGTAIIQSNKFMKSILIISFGSLPKLTILALFIMIFLFISIFVSKFNSTRQPNNKLLSTSSPFTGTNSLRLLAPVK